VERFVGGEIREQTVGGRAQLLDLVPVGLDDQRAAVGEVPLQGADADPGPGGDRLECDLLALLGESRRRGIQQPVAVALRVGAQRTGGGHGHSLSI
jgi:hypothetical protein